MATVESEPVLSPAPAPDLNFATKVNHLSKYVEVVEKWHNASLPEMTSLDRLEHVLFRLFFFDAIGWISAKDSKLSGRGGGVGRETEQTEEGVDNQLFPSHEFHDENQQSIVVKQPSKSSSQQPSKLLTQPIASLAPMLEASIWTQRKPYRWPSYFSDKAYVQREVHTALRPCALVNRSWCSIATPFLWKNVGLLTPLSSYRFLDGLYNISWANSGALTVLPSRTWMTTLKLRCSDGQCLWQTVLRNLLLFPNLRRLSLYGPDPDGISLLFDQDLPLLQHLSIRGCVDLEDLDRFGERRSRSDLWDHQRLWDYGPSVDRGHAHVFFSRLASVKFSWYSTTDVTYLRSPILLNSAHPKLRRAAIPDETSDHDLDEFFKSCSSALSVVCLYTPKMRHPTMDQLATRCTRLRALRLQGGGIDQEGFESLMRLRGPQLVALQLGKEISESFYNPNLIHAVSQYCRSLEYLSIFLSPVPKKEESIEQKLLNLVRRCGPTLRYLSLNLECPDFVTTLHNLSYDSDDNVDENEIKDPRWSLSTAYLIQTIANWCPLLRGLRIMTKNIPDAATPTPDQSTALATLLRQCPQLRTLHLDFSGWDCPEGLRAKLRPLKSDWWWAEKKYFDWENYPLDDSATPTTPT